MKKLSMAMMALLIAAASFAAPKTAGPNDAVLKAFNATFPNAEAVEWFENSDHYLVNFKVADILTKVAYDKDGNFMSSIRYYEGKNLPVNVLNAIKRKHADKKILGVTEITSQEGMYYHIKMEDDKLVYTVRASTDASLETIEKYKKASN